MFFLRNENALERVNAAKTGFSFSFIQAVAFWTGWSMDVSTLHETPFPEAE